ncbi:PREDICTED: uncharacterized protein LOC109116574 [Tarenaya hassleriana]|uniref:uncharacterized protein LOC109116574 n=1 Tax=Tarenaya hassleriana TaxID=28532 RepID=UPI0008FD5795|nr:PREDICTED: uncharacterized protein LOC109116574 [Tarenaya hassleriana]
MHTLLIQFIQNQEKINQEFRAQFASIDAHFKIIDNHIAQLASTSQRPSGSLLGKPETNPREHVNAITFRSGKQVDVEDRPMVERGKSLKTAVVDIPDDEPEPAYVPPPPRPPPIPLYTKYLKDILIKKEGREKETVALIAECSALIQHELPLKRSDPGFRCMNRSSGPDNLVPLHPEIENSTKCNRKKKRQQRKMEERVIVAENNNDTYGAYLQPKYIQQLSCICRPDIDHNNFEFQPAFINMLRPTDFSLLGTPHFSNSFCCRDALKLHDPASQVVEQSGKWFQEDQMILAILHCSMDHDVLSSYVHINTAKELWETLEGAYGNVSNLTRIYELKKSLHNVHQEDKLFVKHLGEFNTIRAELNELRPPSTDSKIVAERLEQDNIFALLSSLHHSYGDLVQHIIRQDKLPSFSEVCAMIKKEEGAKKLFKGTCEIAHYRKVNVSNKLNKHIVCEHCNKAGHTKDKCWIIHPHLKPSKFKENTPHGNPTKESAMVASTSEFVTKADFNKLLQLLKEQKDSGMAFFGHHGTKNLIIDSGATNNMICDKRLLHNMTHLDGDITVANGVKVQIKGQ